MLLLPLVLEAKFGSVCRYHVIVKDHVLISSYYNLLDYTQFPEVQGLGSPEIGVILIVGTPKKYP